MALTLLTGHPRSGTTLLGHLCHTHPDGHFTQELGLFRGLWLPYHLYVLALLDGWRKRNLPAFFRPGEPVNWWPSRGFLWRLIWRLARYRHSWIGPAELEACYRELVPGAVALGDKLPNYSRCLDQYARVEGLRCVVIHRHVFGVIRSYLSLLQGEWKGVVGLSHLDTADKIAAQWAETVRQTMRHRRHVLVMSYEELLANPETELSRLGEWLQLDPSGFDRSLLKAPTARAALDPPTQARIRERWGTELQALGYP